MTLMSRMLIRTMLFAATAVLLPAVDAMCGSITIARNGPELQTIEQLA